MLRCWGFRGRIAHSAVTQKGTKIIRPPALSGNWADGAFWGVFFFLQRDAPGAFSFLLPLAFIFFLSTIFLHSLVDPNPTLLDPEAQLSTVNRQLSTVNCQSFPSFIAAPSDQYSFLLPTNHSSPTNLLHSFCINPQHKPR